MKNRKDQIAIVVIIIGVFLFLFLSGTITSGYHFVDDHEVIRIKNDLQSSSLFNVTKSWVKEDLKSNARFRPVYYIHRVIETKLFGSDFVLWSLYNTLLCCLAFISFYLGMRNLKFSVGESIAFLIITFIGPQSSVWWRLGPGESLGMVFLGFAFFLMSISINKRFHLIKNLFFALLLILSSLTKESFLIIIPGMIFFKIWNEKDCIWSSIKESVIKNLLLLVPLIVLMIEIFIIKNYVGTGYAGLDSNFIDIITSIFSTLMRFIRTYLNLVIIGLLLFIIGLLIKKRIRWFNFFSFVLFCLILLPNIILYAKSGLVERYLLPTSFGLGFLVVTWIKSIEENPGWYKKLALSLVIVSFLPFIVKSSAAAITFAKEGRETNALLSAISTNYVNRNQVMVVVDPVEHYEKSVSLKTYLLYEDKIDLYGYPLANNGNIAVTQENIDSWKSYFELRQFENMTSMPGLLIFFDNKMVVNFFEMSKLSQDDYLATDIGASSFALLKSKQ